MKLHKAAFIFQILIIASSSIAYAKVGEDEILPPDAEVQSCEYQINPDAEEILDRMHPAAQEKFKRLAQMSKGEVYGMLGAAYQAVIEDIILSVPEKYQDELRALYMKSPRTHDVTSSLSQQAQDFVVSGWDTSNWKNIQPGSKDYLDIDVPAETQSVQVAKQLALVKELVRVGHNNLSGIQTPGWRRLLFVFMFNPYPDIMVGEYDDARRLAGYEWDMLNLVKVGDSEILATYFETRREYLLKSATKDAQKKKINKVFEEIKLKVQLASTLTRESYINRQGRRSLLKNAGVTVYLTAARFGLIAIVGNVIAHRFGYPTLF